MRLWQLSPGSSQWVSEGGKLAIHKQVLRVDGARVSRKAVHLGEENPNFKSQFSYSNTEKTMEVHPDRKAGVEPRKRLAVNTVLSGNICNQTDPKYNALHSFVSCRYVRDGEVYSLSSVRPPYIITQACTVEKYPLFPHQSTGYWQKWHYVYSAR